MKTVLPPTLRWRFVLLSMILFSGCDNWFVAQGSALLGDMTGASAGCRAAQGLPGTVVMSNANPPVPICVDFDTVDPNIQLKDWKSITNNGCSGFALSNGFYTQSNITPLVAPSCAFKLPELNISGTPSRIIVSIIHSVTMTVTNNIEIDGKNLSTPPTAPYYSIVGPVSLQGYNTIVEFTKQPTNDLGIISHNANVELTDQPADYLGIFTIRDTNNMVRMLPVWNISSLAVLAVQ